MDKKKQIIIAIIVLFFLTCIGSAAVFSGLRFISDLGVSRVFDNQFGDQLLKTSVALLELHKVRYGEYPENLRDLKYVGEWDRIALYSVRYRPNDDQSAYYIDLVRGWIGKPELSYPPEFWQGTGYDPSMGK